jgi:hypothetical protein
VANNVFDDILNNSQEIVVKAVKNAALKAQNDVIKEAKTYLQEYYSNFSPKMYKRTYRLKRAILPYWADRSSGGKVAIEVGVQYKASALKGAYRSNSWYHQHGDVWIDRMRGDFNYNSPNNGIPEPEWILNNFLHGQHGGYQQDFNSTITLMEEFFENELPNRIGQYVESELFAAITSRL